VRQLPGQISICGKRELDQFVLSNVTHILALEDPDIPKTIPPWFRGVYHRLQFHDVERTKDAERLGAVLPGRHHLHPL
jgi:hypothetical protein